jgi:hypothetical protein
MMSLMPVAKCGSPLNKPLCDLCKPSSSEAFTLAVSLPKFPAKHFPGAHAIVDLPRDRAIIESSTEPPRHRQLHPKASAPSFPTTIKTLTCHHLPWPNPVMPSTTQALPQAYDAIPKSATTSSSPSPRRCAPYAIPELMTPMTHAILRPAAPSASLSLRGLEPVMPSNPRRPWACNVVILPNPTRLHCIFFFVILGLQILILICYIAFVLLHCFDVLHCHIAFIYYIAFNMSHCFDMLHCFWYAALLWYATLPHFFDMLHCHISLICFIACVLLHCFDVLYCHIALICYIAFNMSHCFDMLHCFW